MGCSHCPTQSEAVKINCPAPVKYGLAEMNKTYSEAENMDLLLRNLNAIVEYSLKQESTIECYRASLQGD